MTTKQVNADVGVVAIGRNEGERLRQCLDSVAGRVAQVVYVDSGSSDGSVALARARGVHVVELDTSIPFTAARARNAGYKALKDIATSITFVQFVDGDCEIVDDWLERARQFLLENETTAIVCGRRRERFRDASIFNRLTDMEWDTPVGPAKACGGDAMMRTAVFEQVGQFDQALICGEEPDLCVRVRQAGFTIHRLDAEMTLHDAAMTRVSQWYKRMVRSGWFYAQGAAMHGKPPERHCVRESRRIWVWGLMLPLLALATAWWTWGISIAVAAGLYCLLAIRTARGRLRHGDPWPDAWRYGLWATLGKFPETIGQCRYWITRLRGRQAQLIEYKGAQPTAENAHVATDTR